jgi:hypothetical protein
VGRGFESRLRLQKRLKPRSLQEGPGLRTCRRLRL